MIIKNAELLQTAVWKKQYIKENLPEIALAGRSNVGKSTLINCLVNRKKLARTSSKPGKTRVINFYGINNEFVLVDLPGYGYADAPKTEIESWKKIIEEYLNNRVELKSIILLLDIRHMPNANDLLMYNYILASNLKPIIVFTKSDKFSKQKANLQADKICNKLDIDKKDIVLFSATKGTGRDLLLNKIDEVLSKPPN